MLTSRKVQLLRLLTIKNDWCNSSELASWIGCSGKTVLAELHSLSKELPEGWEVQYEKGKGIRLKRSHTGYNRELDYIALRQDEAIKIILHLFMHPHGFTIRELSYEMFYNITTIQSLLVTIIEYLRPYHLELKKKPVRITGKEQYIRKMMFDLSLYSKRSPHWKSKYNEHLKECISKVEHHFRICYPDQSKNYLICAMNIWLFRMSHHYYFNPPMRLKKAVDHSFELISTIKTIFISLEQTYEINIPDDEYLYLFLLLTSAPKSGTLPELLYKRFNVNVTKEVLQRFIQHLEKSLGVILHHDEIFRYNLRQYLKEALYRWKTEVHVHRNLYTQEIKTMYKKTFQTIQTYFAEYFPFSQAMMDDDIADVVFQILGSLEASKLDTKLQIALITPPDEFNAKHIHSLISAHIAIPNAITCIRDYEIEDHDVLAYDIVITYDPILDKNDSFLYANPLLSKSNLEVVASSTKKLWQKKTSCYCLPDQP